MSSSPGEEASITWLNFCLSKRFYEENDYNYNPPFCHDSRTGCRTLAERRF